MNPLSIVRYPHPLLKEVTRPVSFPNAELTTLVDGMIQLMLSQPRCVGLAAPQVGWGVSLFVADSRRAEKPGPTHGQVVMINPRITEMKGEKRLREGCLSVPDYTGNVVRAEEVIVEGFDVTGKPLRLEASGFEAIVFQHEVDHLNGVLFLDRVSARTDLFRRKNYG